MTSVDVDTGLVKKRISLQTKSQTYHIEVDDPAKSECRDIASFVREMIRESQQSAQNNELDPTEKLQRIKELHDDGVLSDKEFEEKRQKLVDEI